MSVKVVDDLRSAFRDALSVGREHEFGLARRLVRRRDTGELGDLTGPGLGIEPPWVPLLADREGAIDEHLDEVSSLLDLTGTVAVRTVG